MILSFAAVQKSPTDVKNLQLDWGPLLTGSALTSTVTAHDAAAAPGDLTSIVFGGSPAPGLGGVTAIDKGMTGFVQSVQISGGYIGSYSLIAAHITLSDGTDLTRGFQVNIR
jgi:hypothetical protein